jgi:hypothetical protein
MAVAIAVPSATSVAWRSKISKMYANRPDGSLEASRRNPLGANEPVLSSLSTSREVSRLSMARSLVVDSRGMRAPVVDVADGFGLIAATPCSR